MDLEYFKLNPVSSEEISCWSAGFNSNPVRCEDVRTVSEKCRNRLSPSSWGEFMWSEYKIKARGGLTASCLLVQGISDTA